MAGPLFLTYHRARAPRVGADVDQPTGRTRLSYRQAAARFADATAGMRASRWTLH